MGKVWFKGSGAPTRDTNIIIQGVEINYENRVQKTW